MPADRTIYYFLRCAQFQTTSRESRWENAFANTPVLPPRLEDILTNAKPEPAEFYKSYLIFKFRVLAQLERGALIEHILHTEFNELGLDDDKESVDALSKIFVDTFYEGERNAYLARSSQLVPAIVKEKYYFEHSSFRDWASVVEEKHFWYRGVLTNAPLRDKLRNSYEASRIGFVDEINLEYFERDVISTIGKTQISIFQELRKGTLLQALATLQDRRLLSSAAIATGDSGHEQEVDSRHILHLDAESQQTVRTIVSDIAQKFFVREQNPTQREFMEAVVNTIAEQYGCIVDYVSLVAHREMLILLVSSMISRDRISASGGEYDYSVGHGISGSVCYLTWDAEARWVGTNDLESDPRASLYHKRKYTDYGDINDFWLFPIFDTDREALLGAVRVINKRNRQRPGPVWPLIEKLELAEIARTVELFIPLFAGELAEEDSRHGISARSAARIIRETFGGHWIELVFGRTLIAHLMQVALRRVEDKSLGCNIWVIKHGIRPIFEQIFSRYPTVGDLQDDELRTHVRYYSFVDPLFGAFVFNEGGKFVGCVEFKDDLLNKLRQSISDVSSSMRLFVLNRGTQTIRVEDGNNEIIGDIYLREDTGTWVYRDFGGQLNQICAHCAITDAGVRDLVKTVLDRAWRLSINRTGAILAIADNPRNVGGSKASPRLSLIKCDFHLFKDLSTMDGAVLISWNGIIERAGTIVSIGKGGRERSDGDADSVDDLLQEFGNARHAAARGLSQHNPKGLVFTVSQNGGISAFSGGKEIFFRE